jgi:hypothetical protein
LTTSKLAVSIAVLGVTAGVGFSIALASRPAAPPEAPVDECTNLEPDLNIYNLCEQSAHCTYTHAELHDLVYRIARCKLKTVAAQ